MFDKTTRHAVAAALRKYVKIADLAQTTPFHVENGRDRNNGLRYLTVSRNRTPTEGVGEHSIEILRDARPRRREPFLSKETH
jgi:hypothetical protein